MKTFYMPVNFVGHILAPLELIYIDLH